MSLQSHLVELERRRDSLKKEIEKLSMQPSADVLKIAELKRRKLQIKDEIAKLTEPTQTLH
jgi:hypothetical protein